MTLTPYTSTLGDIILLMQNIVKSRIPDANVEKGFPIYDLVITPFADLVLSGRETAHVLQQVNSVLLLFDAYGNLEYPDYEETLRARYFITQDASKATDSYIYLTFTDKTGFVIRRGSTVVLGNSTIEIFPVVGSADSVEWDVVGDLFAYKVPVKTLTGAFSADVSPNWDISNVNAVVNIGELVSAYTTRSITNAPVPALTKQALSDSISNRSYSNHRALRYHFATDKAFSPDDLVATRILSANDREFVEAYKEIYKVTSTGISVPIQVRTGGIGKVMFDYGTTTHSTKGTLEYVSPEEPCPYDAPSFPNRDIYRIRIPNSAGLMQPVAIYSSSDDMKDFSTEVSTLLYTYNSLPQNYTSTQEFDTAKKRTYTTADPTLKLALLPSPAPAYSTSAIYEPGLYVKGPSLFTSMIASVKLYNIADNMPISESAEFPVTLDFTAGNKSVVVTLYKHDSPTSSLTEYAVGSLAAFTPSELSNKTIQLTDMTALHTVIGEITLSIPAGHPTLAEAAELRAVLATKENKIMRGSSILGVANNYIYLEVVSDTASAIHLYRMLHGRDVDIVYIGTDVEKLASSSAALTNKDNKELPTTTIATPYRPSIMHLELARDYLYPLSEAPTTDEVNRYKILNSELHEYFSTRALDIEAFNLRDIADNFVESTGYHLKKLDVLLYTQSGLEVMKGSLTTKDTVSDSLHLTDLTPNLTAKGLPSRVINEEESVMRTPMYKFVLSNTFRTL